MVSLWGGFESDWRAILLLPVLSLYAAEALEEVVKPLSSLTSAAKDRLLAEHFEPDPHKYEWVEITPLLERSGNGLGCWNRKHFTNFSVNAEPFARSFLEPELTMMLLEHFKGFGTNLTRYDNGWSFCIFDPAADGKSWAQSWRSDICDTVPEAVRDAALLKFGLVEG